MFKSQNAKKKEPSKAELALLQLVAKNVSDDTKTQSVPEQESKTEQVDNEIPTPGLLLDMVTAELMHALDDISEQLSFVLYCGEKQGWISEETKAEYAAWRQAQKEDTQDGSGNTTGRNSNIVPRQRSGSGGSRSVMVTQDGSVKYSHPEEPN